MKFHKVTMLIGDEDAYGDPGEWNWEVLDIAPFVYVLESLPITREETPFDQELIKEWEAEEEYEKRWDLAQKVHERKPR